MAWFLALGLAASASAYPSAGNIDADATSTSAGSKSRSNVLAASTLADVNTRPNIIVFFSDDTGFGDMGFNGDRPSETPNLDKLAAEGLRFTDFHVGASVCTPSRAALMTGRLGARTGVTHNFGLESTRGLDTGETTLAELVKTVGYDTKMIGKWHLGHHPEYHPSYRGFDQYVGLPYSNDMGCLDEVPTTGWNWINESDGHMPACAADNEPGPNLWGDTPDLWGDTPQISTKGFLAGTNAVPLYNSTVPDCKGRSAVGDCNKDIVEQPVKLQTLNQRYTDEAVKFVQAHAVDSSSKDTQKPFFLYMPFAHMHVPHGFSPEFVNSSTRRTIYGDTLRELDASVGAVVDTVRKSGLEKNTLIIYTGDNGPWNIKCDLGGSQGPFAGAWQTAASGGGGGGTGKFTTWEAGHREPALAYWRGRIAPGTVTRALASTMDIFPTVASLTGAKLPSDRSYDGVDLSPVLFDGATTLHTYLFHPDATGALNAMRLGELKAFYQTYGAPACGGGAGLTVTHYPPLVFNLTSDPGESTPIEVSPEMLRALDTTRNKTLLDIATTLKHDGHYETGDKSDWGCCNPKSSVCRCEGQPHGDA